MVIPREICRQEDKAFAHEWLVSNGRGSYASGSITGALTRRQHGLLVAKAGLPAPGEVSPNPTVLLAKVDEEVEVEGHVYKLGTNEYSGGVTSPDGFLYLQQVEFGGNTAIFSYEAGRFQLTKTVWLERERLTTYIRYTLTKESVPITLTLLPFCDHRPVDNLTQGSDQWRFQTETLERGVRVTAQEGATPYRILVEPHAAFTPLDLWYWRFQLRAEGQATTDLFVPGLFRAHLVPGESRTLIATCEQDNAIDLDVTRAWERRAADLASPTLPPPDQFTPEFFLTLDTQSGQALEPGLPNSGPTT